MIASKERELTGITALTTRKDHNDYWLRNSISSREDRCTVRFNFFRDDCLENSVGLVSQNDMDFRNKDVSRPDEIAIGASKFFVEKVEKVVFEGYTIYDVYGKVK
jgi:hypothetical protein